MHIRIIYTQTHTYTHVDCCYFSGPTIPWNTHFLVKFTMDSGQMQRFLCFEEYNIPSTKKNWLIKGVRNSWKMLPWNLHILAILMTTIILSSGKMRMDLIYYSLENTRNKVWALQISRRFAINYHKNRE